MMQQRSLAAQHICRGGTNRALLTLHGLQSTEELLCRCQVLAELGTLCLLGFDLLNLQPVLPAHQTCTTCKLTGTCKHASGQQQLYTCLKPAEPPAQSSKGLRLTLLCLAAHAGIA